MLEIVKRAQNWTSGIGNSIDSVQDGQLAKIMNVSFFLQKYY